MKKNVDRRTFLKNMALGGLSISAMPHNVLYNKERDLGDPFHNEEAKDAKNDNRREFNEAYLGKYLNHVAFPIGGMGAGMFCLEGTGAFSHMSVRNGPEIFNAPDIFAAISVKGIPNGSKILEGPVPAWKIFGQRGAANGAAGAIYGLPRFRQVDFKARFPFGTVHLSDDDLPLSVKIEGWSPFIPTDEDNSSLPIGAIEYTFINNGKGNIEAVFSFHSKNFIRKDTKSGKIKKMEGGYILSQGSDNTARIPSDQGDFAVFTDERDSVIDYCWYRGGWWDPVTMVWETIQKGEVRRREPVEKGAPGSSIYLPFKLPAGKQKKIRIMMAWYVPITDLRIGEVVEVDKNCIANSGCCESPADIGLADKNTDKVHEYYKPWYSSKFKNIHQVAEYWKKNYQTLYKNASLFKQAFYESTLPPEVLEAVAANLSILKSPTVLRDYEGRMWNWEGCSDDAGCCHGSCTHVWNYAQAVPHLFPKLERSLRLTEFCEDQNLEGHQNFRAYLPIRPTDHKYYAAADGQLGGIMKVHREWRISGDSEWLKKLFPLVKRSMDYCIKTWDPDHMGIVREPHHNTYDIEFWGPGGMCTSFYLGALKSISEMGAYLNKDVSLYKGLYEKGKKYAETELFNGEYFYQKVEWKNLKATNPVITAEKSNYPVEELELLKKEGPKYQYGIGCLSDGVLGAWIALMCGLDDTLDRNKTRSHLVSVHKYNLKDNLSDHANPQRSTYALGNEGGLLLCTWPHGGKPSLPFVYSDEVWTGIEYQVASHLILSGEVEKGLDIVRTCRKRYDGRIRNPFNEYECGSWYARAMSSYGLLQGLTGVRYDAVEKILYIDSKIGDFKSFLSTETGFGTVSLTKGKPSLKIYYGTIPVKEVQVSGEIKQL